MTITYSEDGRERRWYFRGRLVKIEVWRWGRWCDPIETLTVRDVLGF